jgi:uncharacterized protein
VFHSLIAKIVFWASRRRALVLAAVACAAIAAAFGARSLTFDPDVLSLLPRDGRAIPAFRDYVAQVGSMDALYVVLTAPEDYGIADYRDQVERWSEALRDAPEIARVDAGLADAGRNLQWLSDRRLLLLDDDALESALARFTPAGIRDAVADSRALLAVPSAEVADLVRHDPLGLFALVRESIGSAQAGLSFGGAGGGYVSEDGRSRLLIARPVRPPFDAEFSRALDTRLQEMRQELADEAASEDDDLPPLDVQFAGGHRVAVETEAIVKRESIMNTVGSLALILPLLFIVYRSLWLVAVGAIPSGLALLFVLGGLGFAGARLSSAATGASAMLFGLGVDGVVLLYVAWLHRAPAGDPGSHASALGGPSTSMLLGMWTTAATFYGLTFVDFPSLQQLGRLIGHSMVICGILTLLIIPALLPRRPPATRARGLTMPRLAAWTQRRRGAIVAGALVLTAILGACARELQIDPTLDRLRSVTGAARLETEIAGRFGLPSDVYIVLASGGSIEPLLETNERLAAAVERDLPGVASQLPSAVVPSEARQASAAARIAQAQLTPDDVRASLERARAAEGFRAGTFEPFETTLPRLLDSRQRLTYDAYVEQGLGDLLEPLIVRRADGWTLVSYFFPEQEEDVEVLERIVTEVDASQTVTGLPLVNRELADRFVPQFIKGLVIGTVLVIAIVIAAFRDWRLSLFALLPTVIGLVWTAGLLALAGIELDLFAMFAVVTFLGIGVDYGIHLVHRYQERGNAEQATAELAPVIFVAGAITLLGYGTLINSSYPPLQSIGAVSAVSVVALAAASVVVLPALLQWGRRS